MLITLDSQDPRPVYRQIADEVRRCIAVGVFKVAEPVPAVRALASELGVNPNTVQHAYRVLEQEGAVMVRRGLGTFVLPGKPREGRGRQQAIARQIAERMLREAYRHGLLAEDLVAALREIATAADGAGGSGAGGQEQV
jgi:GntR family transcriptional regulator